MRPVCLIVRDGWGYNEDPRGNAVLAADTPQVDRLKARYPWTLLDCAGEAVGLPEGFQGSSEVGHLNMGAGRIVVQEVKRINDSLEDASLYEREQWKRLIANWKEQESTLHLLGLLQDEGVHAHQAHLFAFMRHARHEYPQGAIVVHPFLDGRDTPPRSSLEFLAALRSVMEEVGRARIGTVMGRYYGMDRGQNWALTDQAFRCLVSAEGRRAPDAETAVKRSYEEDQTPDHTEMTDEYIPPTVLEGYESIRDGDSVLHTNYRQDRAIQLSMAFVAPDYPGELDRRPDVAYVGLTQYYDEFEPYLMQAMTSGKSMGNLLGEVIARAELRQLRIAETQKFRHVTSFFNGKATKPFPKEEQVDVPSRFDPASFASHPEMEAYNVTDELLKRLENNPYAFIAVNYANCDMVGHTGNFEASKKAVQVVDQCVGKLVPCLLDLDAHVLVTADHGNAEQKIDYDTEMTKTSHTLHPVEFIYVARDAPGTRLRERGKLADIAVTILHLLGLEVPAEMTADNLIVT